MNALLVPALAGASLLLALLCAAPAQAHAVLLDAVPGPGQHVLDPPRVVFLRFTEDVEKAYTRAEVVDPDGVRRDTGDVRFQESRRNEILVPLAPLADGIYTVRWYTLSIDTHTAQGSYLFAVGNATLDPAQAAAGSARHAHAQDVAFWAESAGRAAFFAGAALAAGLAAFVLLVAGPVLRGVPDALAKAALVASVAASVGGAVVLAAFAARVGVDVAGAVLGTQTGALLLARTLLAGSMAVVLAAAWSRRRSLVLWLAIAGLGGLTLATTSFSGHAGAVRGWGFLPVLADLAHLVAGAGWLGGVVGLLLVAKDRSETQAGALVSTFSPLAVAAVSVVVGTGVFASLLHLPRVEDLWSTLYGLAVVAKASLVAPLVALGAYNKFRLAPALYAGRAPPSRLRRSVAVEAVLFAGILAAAGVLATSPPPEAVEPERGGPLLLEKTLERTHLVVAIAPNPPAVGNQSITVAAHGLGGALPDGTEVFLKLAAPGRPEPDALLAPERASAETWFLSGGLMTERGAWTLYVILQRPDEYAKVSFPVVVQ